MAHVVSGKLRKAPYIKPGCGQDGQSTMYGIELAEVNKHYQTGEKSYTNYRVIFFAKSQAANEFYAKAFTEGSFVTVACEKLKINVSECGQYIKLDMENPRLEGCLPASEQGSNPHAGGWGQPQQPQQPQAQQAQQQQPKAPQQAPQQAQPQYNEPSMDFDDDIPFAPIGLMHSNSYLHCI